MKRLATLSLAALFLTPGAALADGYVFNCNNFWQQSVVITVEADSKKDAWKIIRTDKDLRNAYSLDNNSRCAFRASGPNIKQKKMQLFSSKKEGEQVEENKEPVSPTE